MSKVGPALKINMTNYHDALTDTRIMGQMLVNMVAFLRLHRDVDIKKYQAQRIQTNR